MAKDGAIQIQKKRERLVAKYAEKRAALKAIANDENLAELPRNSAPGRLRNRCGVSGRPRGYYRKLKMSRIALRELASQGLVPGMTKSSW
ncbi:UNVERIFIED_CONTAM: hypothetical protein GTU68_020625 [Idotea baltica]|nr:hypothetical protein [Idotea baltica]